MTVYCSVCDRVIASRQPYVDAQEFVRLHAKQNPGHVCELQVAA